MREKDIEKALVSAVKSFDGVCWKFVSPGTAGVPDRIILMPNGRWIVYNKLDRKNKAMV